MQALKLKDRIESYSQLSNFHLLNRVPLITCINGRSFSKITSFLEKPFSQQLADSLLSTAVKLSLEIEGAVFAYQYNDEIVVVSRNDQSLETAPWYDNKIQKICSITSSIATQHFNNIASSSQLNIIGDALFTSQVFAVPNIMEAINCLIYKQQHNFYVSIQLACYYELLKKYDKNTIKELLADLTIDEKISLLKQECNINFNDYPAYFRRGAACFKTPKNIDGTIKNKWVVSTELPIFTSDHSYLNNIIKP